MDEQDEKVDKSNRMNMMTRVIRMSSKVIWVGACMAQVRRVRKCFLLRFAKTNEDIVRKTVRVDPREMIVNNIHIIIIIYKFLSVSSILLVLIYVRTPNTPTFYSALTT
jgi:hypothetical protein